MVQDIETYRCCDVVRTGPAGVVRNQVLQHVWDTHRYNPDYAAMNNDELLATLRLSDADSR